jgi:hypothetical protein
LTPRLWSGFGARAGYRAILGRRSRTAPTAWVTARRGPRIPRQVGITHETIRAAIDRMSSPEFWENQETRSAILARVPEYRRSKFQLALPEWAAAEMVGAYLLDFSATRSFLCADA